MKCGICSSETGETFLGKLDGTLVKLNENGKNRTVYICPECQKEYRENIKEKIKEAE